MNKYGLIEMLNTRPLFEEPPQIELSRLYYNELIGVNTQEEVEALQSKCANNKTENLKVIEQLYKLRANPPKNHVLTKEEWIYLLEMVLCRFRPSEDFYDKGYLGVIPSEE